MVFGTRMFTFVKICANQFYLRHQRSIQIHDNPRKFAGHTKAPVRYLISSVHQKPFTNGGAGFYFRLDNSNHTDKPMYLPILIIHIIAGFAALFSSGVAVFTKLVRDNHRVHTISGNVFCCSMTAVFLTAVPLTIIRPNLFLFVIAVFSFYLTFNGWRMALNRSGYARLPDRIGAWIMIATAVAMVAVGGYYQFQGNGFGIVLLVFGFIGGLLAFENLRRFARGKIKGKERISSHQGSMIGATIAAITAFLVTNITTDPVWIAWIAPTVLLTPLIIYNNRRLFNKKKKKSGK